MRTIRIRTLVFAMLFGFAFTGDAFHHESDEPIDNLTFLL